MGYALPPGTIVSTQAWSMHRDTSVFPSPDTFLPDRWLEVRELDAGKSSFPERSFMIFFIRSPVIDLLYFLSSSHAVPHLIYGLFHRETFNRF